MRTDHLETLPSDELLCLPFLDTDVSGELAQADAILASRGCGSRMRRLLRGIAKRGLWFQFAFEWEWCSLGWPDVALGYSLPLLGASLVVAVAVVPFGWHHLLWALSPALLGCGLLTAAAAGSFYRRRQKLRARAVSG